MVVRLVERARQAEAGRPGARTDDPRAAPGRAADSRDDVEAETGPAAARAGDRHAAHAARAADVRRSPPDAERPDDSCGREGAGTWAAGVVVEPDEALRPPPEARSWARPSCARRSR